MQLSKSTISIIFITQTTHFYCIKGAKSKLLQTIMVFPRVQFLALFYFFLYVNDIPQAVNCMSILFADDTCLVFLPLTLLPLLKL